MTAGAALQVPAPTREALARTAAGRVEQDDGELPTRRFERGPGASGRDGSLDGLTRASVIGGGRATPD
jgi:hypothetical protein